MPSPLAVRLAVAVLLLAAAPRADVLVVDASGGAAGSYADISLALADASDGDILLVVPGQYPAFTVEKAVSIVTDAGGFTRIDGAVLVRDLPPGGHVVLSGMRPAIVGGAAATFRMTVDPGAGSVLLRDVVLRTNDSSFPALRIRTGNSVSLVDCVAVSPTPQGGGNPTISASASTLFLHGSVVRGGPGKSATFPTPGGNFGFPGAAGLSAFDCEVYVDDSTILGGDGGSASIGNCHLDGNGGHAIVATGASARVVHRESTIVGGAGADSGPCPAAPDGLPIVMDLGTQTPVSGPTRRLAVDTPVREGEAFTVTSTAVAGDLAWLALSFGAAPSYDHPSKIPLVVAPPFHLEFLGSIPDATTVDAVGPFVPASVDGFPVLVQGLYLDALGTLRASNAHEFVLLSDTF